MSATAKTAGTAGTTDTACTADTACTEDTACIADTIGLLSTLNRLSPHLTWSAGGASPAAPSTPPALYFRGPAIVKGQTT